MTTFSCRSLRLVCQVYLQHFLSVAELLSIPVKHSKTVLPSTCVVVHGIEVDTLVMQARLPQDKLDAAITLVKSFKRRKKVTLRELQSCIGTLQFAAKVVVGGRPFLRRLYDLIKGIVKRLLNLISTFAWEKKPDWTYLHGPCFGEL